MQQNVARYGEVRGEMYDICMTCSLRHGHLLSPQVPSSGSKLLGVPLKPKR